MSDAPCQRPECIRLAKHESGMCNIHETDRLRTRLQEAERLLAECEPFLTAGFSYGIAARVAVFLNPEGETHAED